MRITNIYLLYIILISGVLSCQKETQPLREWTAADHDHPSSISNSRDERKLKGERNSEINRDEQTGSDGESTAVFALFRVHCAKCHGRSGEGDGPSRPEAAHIPNFTEQKWHESISDSRMTDAIRHGRKMMPGIGDKINRADMAKLIDIIRGFSQK